MYGTATQVIELIKLIEGHSPIDIHDLDFLAVDLPLLRRPSGRDGERDLARYRMLPPALRAVTILFVLRAEVRNGGADQFVWNQDFILAETIEAFAHIGATGAAGFLLELGKELLESDSSEENVVTAFLAFRSQVGDQGWNSDDVDLVGDVEEALMQHARTSPEEFVVAAVESEEWTAGGEDLRSTILRRPDGLFEVAIHKAVIHEVEPTEERTESPTQEVRWHEMPRDAECLSTVDAARLVAKRERSKREVAPTQCGFKVSQWSESRLWPTEKLALDLLPVGASLLLRFHKEGQEATRTGRFVSEDFGRYGRIVMDEDAPTDNNAYRGWQAECLVCAPSAGPPLGR